MNSYRPTLKLNSMASRALSKGQFSLIPRRFQSLISSGTNVDSLFPNEVSVYVHWPFCESKCTYCSFNKYVNPPTVDHSRFKKAFLSELSHSIQPYKGRKIHSVYFGGGTPSLAEPSTFEALLELLRRECVLEDTTEVTIEGNPTSIETKKFHSFKEIGVNRVSLGIQALNNIDLKLMGRDHSYEDGLRSLETINKLFDNTTFDMIFARPNQSLTAWKDELKLAMSFAKNHMSVYQLMIEAGTPFYKLHQKGLLPLPTTEVIEDMYHATIEVMAEKGFKHYEVSSFGRNDVVGIHNFSYWRGVDYIGIGPGAHGRAKLDKVTQTKNRTYRILSPEHWLRSCEEIGHGMRKHEEMSPEGCAKELIVLGLRTKYGVSLLQARALYSSLEDVLCFDTLASYAEKGFVEVSGSPKAPSHVAPTEQGLAVIDSLLVEIFKI